ncbi:hypothetical protein J6590_088286 [Homalodisca vitripennis]|nr:hypothetical protein J6590_088286 [Homalodisca vitripennis]
MKPLVPTKHQHIKGDGYCQCSRIVEGVKGDSCCQCSRIVEGVKGDSCCQCSRIVEGVKGDSCCQCSRIVEGVVKKMGRDDTVDVLAKKLPRSADPPLVDDVAYRTDHMFRLMPVTDNQVERCVAGLRGGSAPVVDEIPSSV